MLALQRKKGDAVDLEKENEIEIVEGSEADLRRGTEKERNGVIIF